MPAQIRVGRVLPMTTATRCCLAGMAGYLRRSCCLAVPGPCPAWRMGLASCWPGRCGLSWLCCVPAWFPGDGMSGLDGWLEGVLAPLAEAGGGGGARVAGLGVVDSVVLRLGHAGHILRHRL